MLQHRFGNTGPETGPHGEKFAGDARLEETNSAPLVGQGMVGLPGLNWQEKNRIQTFCSEPQTRERRNR